MNNDTIDELLRRSEALARRIERLETLENNMAQNHGYVNAAWQKDPIRLGYSDVIRVAITNTSLPAGASSNDSAVVPAGEIWIITNITVAYSGTVAGVALATRIVDTGASSWMLWDQRGLTSGIFYDRQGWWVLKPGEKLRVDVTGATLNDDVYLRAVGTRVDIDL